MSSSISLFGYTIIYPKLNILILTRDGERYLFRSYFFEWYFYTSICVGSYFGYKFLRRIPRLLNNFYLKIRPKQLKANNLAIIFGFGDSLASIQVTKALITLGFNLILINKKESLEHRKKYFMNKNEHIEEVDKNGLDVSYEDILEKPEILKEIIANNKIDFIFDFTSFRITIDTGKIIKETEDMLNKNFNEQNKSENDNFIQEEKLKEKEKEKIEEKIEEGIRGEKSDSSIGSFGNTNLQKRLNQSALQYYNSKIFYSEEISKHVNEVIMITEYLIPFMDKTKIMMFDYRDKANDVNHKLMVDFQFTFFDNLKNMTERKNIIKYVKKINGLINYKYKQFTEQDALSIIRYSDYENFQYSFV